eukprot:CAMPEP_0119421424 /NCGR_PEP_ID=MMETSP1335-20130426/25885_1 /TAXON_ID=259385 /ORGANISM="Chrysoculter rhomboideus, Strain RCC1486" /LENGTH=66 /DNA_ID=CAMNT_0007446829 /DNA_START=330 /DNA_END=527 /DNA_ORIENTATION=-
MRFEPRPRLVTVDQSSVAAIDHALAHLYGPDSLKKEMYACPSAQPMSTRGASSSHVGPNTRGAAPI